MKSKEKCWGIFCVILCLCLVTIVGCKKSSDAQLVPAGVLMEYNGCKQFLANAAEQFDGFAPGPHEDCFEYQYDGTNTLVFRHINAGFNCCPGEITAEIEFNGNVITLTEREAEQGCFCQCLFDLDYELVNLAPGQYTLRFIEPYAEENDQALEFTLSLLSATSGSHCVQRNYYPWGQ
jgi:hypothetical protein